MGWVMYRHPKGECWCWVSGRKAPQPMNAKMLNGFHNQRFLFLWLPMWGHLRSSKAAEQWDRHNGSALAFTWKWHTALPPTVQGPPSNQKGLELDSPKSQAQGKDMSLFGRWFRKCWRSEATRQPSSMTEQVAAEGSLGSATLGTFRENG